MYNNITLSGYLCDKPAFSVCSNGKSKCSFSIAVRRYNDKTDFFNCIAYEPTCNAFRSLAKGSLVLLNGRLEQCRKEDRTWYSIIVEKVVFFPRNTSKPTEDVVEESELELAPF